jgi:hypothetical protein
MVSILNLLLKVSNALLYTYMKQYSEPSTLLDLLTSSLQVFHVNSTCSELLCSCFYCEQDEYFMATFSSEVSLGWARGSVVGGRIMLQAGTSWVRFPMRSLDFSQLT